MIGLLVADVDSVAGIVTLGATVGETDDPGSAAVETMGDTFSGVKGTIPLQNSFLPRCLWL